jgi:hypothetical protein
VQLKKSTSSKFSWEPNLAWAAAVGAALCMALIYLPGLKEFKYAGF